MKKKYPSFLRTGRLLLFSFLIIISAAAYAQQSVTGIVTDGATNQPLAGATVMLKGTTMGTVSDLTGHYTIKVTGPNDVLVFSFIGYETREVIAGTQTKIDVVLNESAKALDELVVIGYGTVKKSDLTGAVAVVSSADLNKIPAANLTQALQGRAAGVIVTQSSGSPDAAPSIKVRGIGSINKSSDPIYVVDGQVTGSLGSVSPNDIESLQVLKDASASAIYGADGANGVIIITTKRGKAGKTQVSFSSYTSFNSTPKQLAVMNADQYARFYNDINKAAGIYQIAYSDSFRQAYYGQGWQKGTNWQDEIVQKAHAQNYYVSVSGGGENSNYNISGRYYDETGTLRGGEATRFNFRANSDFKIGKLLKVGESLAISRSTSVSGGSYSGNPWQVSTIASPLMKIFNPSNKEGYAGPQETFYYQGPTDTIPMAYKNTGLNDKTNPRGELDIGYTKNYGTNILANIYVEFAPVKWLTYKITPSIDLSSGKSKVWAPAFDIGVRSQSRASDAENYWDNMGYSLENQLTFNKSFGDHNITATIVAYARGGTSTSLQATGMGYNYENLNTIYNATETQNVWGFDNDYARMISYLGRLIYDYKGKFLFTGSLRRDGSSNFAPSRQFGNFPAFSVGYKINEDFLQNVKQINMLKLRFGWGKTGNSAINQFQYDDFLTGSNSFSPVFGNPPKMALATEVFYSFANPIIKWEAAAMTNIGFDLSAFNNKLQVSAEYYVKNQDDLLVQRSVSVVFGRSGDGSQPWVNLGKLQNKGVEVTVQYKMMEGAFNYSITGTLTTIKNRVKSIPAPIGSGNNETAEGHAIGQLYGYVAERIITTADFDTAGKYKYPIPSTIPTGQQPAPGDLKYADLNHDGVINDLDRTFIGKSIPDFTYSLNFECSFKGFDFSMFLNGMQNFDIFNQQLAELTTLTDQDLNHNKLVEWTDNYYTTDRPSTKYIRADISNINKNSRLSTWWIEKGSFLRFKDLQLGYTLPSNVISRVGIGRARLYVSASNLAIITKYKGRDPEGAAISSPLTSGTDDGSYPIPRSYTLGLQVDF